MSVKITLTCDAMQYSLVYIYISRFRGKLPASISRWM